MFLLSYHSKQNTFTTNIEYYNKKSISSIKIISISKSTNISIELGSIDMSYLSEDIYENGVKNPVVIYQNITQFILCKTINKQLISSYTLQEQQFVGKLFQEATSYMSDYYETNNIIEIEKGK